MHTSFYNVAFNEAPHREVLDNFRQKMRSAPWTSLALAGQDSDLTPLEDIAAHWRTRFEDVIILGTGGSSLGGKTICALAPSARPRMHFLDNIDYLTFERLFQDITLENTGVLVISKSGTTAETLTQFLTCLPAFIAKGLSPANHFLAITEPHDNVLRTLATEHGLPILDHPTDVGGRFSCLSLVSLLPAMIAGVDVFELRRGAACVLSEVMDSDSPAPFQGAVAAHTLAQEKGIHYDVIMPYVDSLGDFGFWYRQLWAESLGKVGKGRTPIRAMGTVDQHSQLQLYLDGPHDKFFTVITTDATPVGPVIQGSGIDYLDGRTMGDLLRAEQQATIETLRRKGCPLRVIHVDTVTPYVLGQLFMHYMIETIMMADLMVIDPFNQPAVEEGKIIARQLMKDM